MTQRWFRTAVAVLTCALVPLSLSAQRMPRRVFIDAYDGSGSPVLNLTTADLRVTENNVPREVTRVALGNAPMQIVRFVDSSGANAFLDTLIESDQRFLRTAPGQWPVFVILTTDNGEARADVRLDDYNKFVTDYMARGGTAHAVIIAGKQLGLVTDLVLNLVENTGGIHGSINTPNSLPERLKNIAERPGGDHKAMVNRYEVDFTSDAKVLQPIVNVIAAREGINLEMSPRRPF